MTAVESLARQPTALANTATSARNSGVARTGRVVQYDSGSITVRISGSDVLVSGTYIRQYDPDLGDTVVVLRSGASWIILGSFSGNPEDNAVKNYSFEDDPAGTAGAPTGWTYYHDPASTLATTVDVNTGIGNSFPPPDGSQQVQLKVIPFSGPGVITANDILSSSPIPVTPGQRWAASAYALASAPAEIDGLFFQGIVNLRGHANSTETAPNGTDLSSKTSIIPLWQPWTFMKNNGPAGETNLIGTLIPAGINFLRVSLYSSILVNQPAIATSGSAYMFWDRVIARRIS